MQTQTILMRPVVSDQTYAGKIEQALKALDDEARLVARQQRIAWKNVKRELTGTPTNMVATYTAPLKGAPR